MFSAGIETYASLVAATLAAFQPTTHFVFFDDPSEQHVALPLLPIQHRSKLRNMQREPQGNYTSPEKVKPGPEPRSMQLSRMMEYFCDGVGEIDPEGGSEEILWYRLTIRRTAAQTAVTLPALEAWTELDKRYAVHREEDEVGYSGRERWTVRFT